MDDWKKDDEVWDLLGRARPVKVSPFFARRVRNSIPKPDVSPLRQAFLRWAGVTALVAMAAGFFMNVSPEADSRVVGFESAEFIEVYDRVAGLDVLSVTDPVSAVIYGDL
ncbi:MAG: hypothetical protein SFU53_13245 [Terrimicrobiaceae bacterium]|nr:hypothetical protein [Terrimicrobiaceae bacterium]